MASFMSLGNSSRNIVGDGRDQPYWAKDLPNTLDGLLYHEIAEKAFACEVGYNKSNLFAETSKADIFEVSREDGGTLREGADDNGIRSWLENDKKDVKMSMIFIDGVHEKPDSLPVTESLLRDIFKSFDVSLRFADSIYRQHPPGREVHRRQDGSTRHQMWYTAVVRSQAPGLNHSALSSDLGPSRFVCDWQRLCIWSGYWSQRCEDGSYSTTETYLLWRCPPKIKRAFFDTFTGVSGAKLLDHPLSVHVFIMQRIVLHTYDFLEFFSVPLYEWESKASKLQTPDDYTKRSRAFLALSRQIHQVSTDFDILSLSVQHLHDQTKWFSEILGPVHEGWEHLQDLQPIMGDIFDSLLREVKMIATYSQLYLERSKIGVDECFAMTNQRDSELNIEMARASHQDNRSLRIIQLLSMIFLPASLVSSIFGMGFFTTEPPDGNGGGVAVFWASGRWWLYLAVTVPLTVAVMAVMQFYQYRDGSKAQRESRRKETSVPDPEAQLYEKKEL